MKSKNLIILLLVIVLGAGITYFIAKRDSSATTSETTSAEFAASGKQLERLSKEELNEWVQGLRVAFPYYQIELRSYEDINQDRSTASIAFIMGKPLDTTAEPEERIYLESLIKLDIEQGLKTVNGVDSIARIHANVELQEGTSPDLFEIYDVMAHLSTLVQQDSVNLIRPNGEFYTETKTQEDISFNLGDINGILSPFTYQAETYDGKRLLQFDMHIPSMRLNNPEVDYEILVNELRAINKDRTIRDGLYDLNMDADIQIAKIVILDQGEQRIAFNDFIYTEKAAVGNNGLAQSQFTVNFSGQETYSTELLGNSKVGTGFDFSLEGDFRNFHAKSYASIKQDLLNNPAELMADDQSSPVLAETLGYGPELNLNKFVLTYNGYRGEGFFKMKMPTLTDAEKKMPFVEMLMAKLDVDGQIRVPIQWFVNPKATEQEREQTLEMYAAAFADYIVRDGDYFVSAVIYKEGELLLNGKQVSY